MGRQKTIDRNVVLDAAERVVSAQGANRLTIGEVAREAGITKGGVQSCFGTKEGLVEAMLARSIEVFEADIAAMAGPAPSTLEMLRGHVHVTARSDDASTARSASLMAALMDSPEHLGAIQQWYAARLHALDAMDGPQGVNARMAFLATEGLFLLRHCGLLPMQRPEWETRMAEVAAHLDRPAP